MGDSKVFYCGENEAFLVKCQHCGAIYAVQSENIDTVLSSVIESNCKCGQCKTKDDWRYIRVSADEDNGILIGGRLITQLDDSWIHDEWRHHEI